mgnify:CR=1 FL=1
MKGPAHHRWSPAGGGGGYREDGDHLHRLVHLAGNCVDWSSIRKRWPSRTLPAGVPWPPHNLTERCRLSDRVTCSRVTDRRPGVSLAAGVPVRRDPAFLLPSGTRRCKTACPWAWLAAPAKPPARNIRNRLVPALRITDGRRGAPEDKFFRWSQKTAFIHPIEAVFADESGGEGRQAKYALKASMLGWFYASPLQRKPERRPGTRSPTRILPP